MNYKVAARLIGTRRFIISKLVILGSLADVGECGSAKLLRSVEVQRFAAKYVPLLVAARNWKITPSKILSGLESSSLP
jgi:hypothetical protein